MNSIRTILSSLKKADNDFNLLKDKEKIVVYVDGSPSSLAMAKALSVYPYYSRKNNRFLFVTVDYGFNELLIAQLKTLIANLNVLEGRDIVEINNAKGKEGSTSSFLKLERKLLVLFAKEHKATKIALSSTHEDSLEHLFKGMINDGRISSLRPRSKVNGTNISFIRPLIYCFDSDIERYINEEEIKLLPSNNPWINGHSDEFISINKTIENYKPDWKENTRKALNDEKPILYKDSKEWQIGKYVMKKDNDSTDIHTVYKIRNNKDLIGKISYLLIDHHLAKVSYSKMDDSTLVRALDLVIEELVNKAGRITIYFSNPRKPLIEYFNLRKLNVRGKMRMATKISK